MRTGLIGSPDDRTEIMRILYTVKQDDERILLFFMCTGKYILYSRILIACTVCYHALMLTRG